MLFTGGLRWEPPNFPQGTILEYNVLIYDLSNNETREVTIPGDATLFVSLSPGDYVVQVSVSAVCMVC